MIRRVLYICAHPDDCELMFGGIISNLVRKNIEISLIVVSDGGKWMRDKKTEYTNIKLQRKAEALAAAKVLGIKNVELLNYEDGMLEKQELRDSLLKTIRKINPNIIFTHSEEEKHTDHIEVSKAVKRLCNQLSEPAPILNDFWEAEYPPVTDFQALYTYATIDELNLDSTFFVPLKKEDISNKINAVLCHKSQFGKETKAFLSDKVMTEAKFLGNLCGTQYAETFRRVESVQYRAWTIM